MTQDAEKSETGQQDSVSLTDFESVGREFESPQARHVFNQLGCPASSQPPY